MNDIYWRWAVINNLDVKPTLKHLLLAILFYQRDGSSVAITSHDLAADMGITYRHVNSCIGALAVMGINVRVTGGFGIDFEALDGWVKGEASGE